MYQRKGKFCGFSLNQKIPFSLLRRTNASLSILISTNLCDSKMLQQRFSRDNRRPSQKSRRECAREVLEERGERKSVS